MRKRRAIGCAVLALLGIGLGALGVGLLAFGSVPLENGALLADGAVEVVADGFIAAYLVKLPDGGLLLIDATMDSKAKVIAPRFPGATGNEQTYVRSC